MFANFYTSKTLMAWYLVGAPIAGRMSDQILIKWKRRRGEWVPEDRLRAALFAAATLAPLSVLFSGILTAWGGGTVSLVLNLVCLFVNGLAVSILIFHAERLKERESGRYGAGPLRSLLHRYSARSQCGEHGCQQVSIIFGRCLTHTFLKCPLE